MLEYPILLCCVPRITLYLYIAMRLPCCCHAVVTMLRLPCCGYHAAVAMRWLQRWEEVRKLPMRPGRERLVAEKTEQTILREKRLGRRRARVAPAPEDQGSDSDSSSYLSSDDPEFDPRTGKRRKQKAEFSIFGRSAAGDGDGGEGNDREEDGRVENDKTESTKERQGGGKKGKKKGVTSGKGCGGWKQGGKQVAGEGWKRKKVGKKGGGLVHGGVNNNNDEESESSSS